LICDCYSEQDEQQMTMWLLSLLAQQADQASILSAKCNVILQSSLE